MCSRPENSQQNSESQDRLRFREAHLLDRLTVRRILHEANLSFHATNEADSSSPGELGHPRVYLCERGGEIVGVLQWRNLGDEAEILDVAVGPAQRRQGIANFLLRKFLQVMLELGIHQIYLEVRESNHPAVSLYRSLGFAISGRRENYYRHPNEAALLFTLKIPG